MKRMDKDRPLVYRVEEVARMLSISRSEAYALIAKEVIPHIRIGSMIRVPAAALKLIVERSARGERDEAKEGGRNDAA
jgi:excisionase family DNA binding protein